MDPMNESDSTRTMNGSLRLGLDDEGAQGQRYAHSEPGGVVRVELQHGVRGPAGTSGARRIGPRSRATCPPPAENLAVRPRTAIIEDDEPYLCARWLHRGAIGFRYI
jgi:hypothetical protein